MLQEIAGATGGRYEPLGQQAEGLEAIYREKLSLVPKTGAGREDAKGPHRKIPVAPSCWPLSCCWRSSPFPTAKRAGKPFPPLKPLTGAFRKSDVWQAPLPLGCWSCWRSFSWGLGGRMLLQVTLRRHTRPEITIWRLKGTDPKPKKSPEEPQLKFNLGTAAYKGKQYPEALASFKRALNVQDIHLQNQSYYNMGNTLYRQGEETEKQNPQQTIQQWEASIQAYDKRLEVEAGGSGCPI